jgi:hypothetical protein
MSWVNVPVPEELVDDVQALLFQLRFRSDVPRFDHVAMGEHLRSLAPEPLALVCAVAQGVVAGEPVEDVDLAERLGVTVRELYGLVSEANDVTVRPFQGNLVFVIREQVPDDESLSFRRLHMLAGYAQMVVEHMQVLGPRGTGTESR